MHRITGITLLTVITRIYTGEKTASSMYVAGKIGCPQVEERNQTHFNRAAKKMSTLNGSKPQCETRNAESARRKPWEYLNMQPQESTPYSVYSAIDGNTAK